MKLDLLAYCLKGYKPTYYLDIPIDKDVAIAHYYFSSGTLKVDSKIKKYHCSSCHFYKYEDFLLNYLIDLDSVKYE